jgi:DNA repair exonuclease SbcCD ATPase subunit
MRITKVTIKDFNRIGEVTLDLAACPLLSMIAGRCDSAGADSNGSGKSSVLSAICWCIYGKEIRKNKRPVENVIRHGADATRVTVELEHAGKPFMVIERGRRRSGKVELLVDGKEFGTVQGGQEHIERRLGFTYDLFTRTVIFGGDMSAFCQMSPGDRTRILEEMLGVHHFLEAEKLAKEQIKETTGELEAFTAKRQAWKNSIEQARDEFQRNLEVYSASLDDYERRKRVLQEDIFDNVDRSFRLREKLRNKRAESQAMQSAYEAAVAEHEKLIREQEACVDDLRKQSMELNSVVSAAEAEMKIQRNKVRDLKSRKRPDVCPTCGQLWGSRDVALNIKPEEERLARLEETWRSRSKKQDEAEKKYSEAKLKLQKIRSTPPKRPDQQTGVSDIHDRIVECEGELRAALAAMERLIEDCEPWGHGERMMRSLEEFRQRRKMAFTDEGKISSLTRRVAVLDYWKQAFGKGGLPAMLLKSTAPELNRLVKPFADYLTAGAYTFHFELAENNGQSFFQISVKNVDGGDAYEDLSKGELARVDLCVLLAIRALMQQKSPVKFDQIFLDEIADGLDRTGTEYFIRLLRTKKIAPQVVFISHDNTMQEAADKVFLLEKREGVTRLVQRKSKK